MIEQTEQEALSNALLKVKAQKENFGFMERFTVDENYVVRIALEKQIPKKPLIRYENMGFGISPNETFKIKGCPCCKEDLDSDETTYFCQNCGQAIDWEGVE